MELGDGDAVGRGSHDSVATSERLRAGLEGGDVVAGGNTLVVDEVSEELLQVAAVAGDGAGSDKGVHLGAAVQAVVELEAIAADSDSGNGAAG